MGYQSVNQFLNENAFHFGHMLHITISWVAFLILGIAVIQATVLSFQHQILRRKRISTMMRFFPSLETMEWLLFKSILLGFILLSFSLLSAWLVADRLYASQQSHKVLLSAMAWTFFAILLIGRYKAGWRGPTAIRWTLTGFLLLIVAYFSSKMIFLKTWTHSP